MDCSWIKIYDAPINGTLLNPNTLYADQVIYVDISELPTDYDFIAWKDLQGNLLDDTVISMVDGGRYKTTASCGGGFVAYVRTREEKICLVVVQCDSSEGTVQRGDGYDVCGATITISAVPQCCYEFDRWSDNDTEHNTENPRDVLVMQGVNTYTANFVEKEFPISVSVNDDDLGTATLYPNVVKCGEKFTLTATPSDKCVFDHWEPGDYTNTTVTIKYNCGDPLDYMAYFSKIPRYTITYHNNCPGTTIPDIVDEFAMGDSVTYRIVTNSDYTFLGWSFSPNASTPDIDPGASGLFDYGADIELYGVWEPKEKYTVRYFGKPGDDTYEWENTDAAYEGDQVILMTVDPQAGYNFEGWILVKQGDPFDPNEQPVTGQVEMIQGGLDAHSVWSTETTYTLKYIMNDNGGTIINVTNIASGQTVTVKSPTELGFSYPYHYFITWSGNGTTYNPGATITFGSNNIDLTASWRTDEVTLTYDTSSADSGTVSPVTVYRGMEVVLDNGSGVVRSGYTFGGWSATDGGSALNSPITLDSDLTVYPVWNRESRYTVTYNSRSCPVSDTNQYRSGDTVTVLNCTCVSETGCKCSGWTDQNGRIYLNGRQFNITQNMVFTEYWDCCDVTFLTNNKTAVLTINREEIRWGSTVNIDEGDFNFDVTVEKGCCFEGWFDLEKGLFINPCEGARITGYSYIFIPSDYVRFINPNNVVRMRDIDFISEINRPSLGYRDNLIIYNEETGEYRQAVPDCGGDEAYILPCGGTVVAIVNCDMYQETVRGEYDYYRYEGTFRSLYEFMDSVRDAEILYPYNIVNINGVEKYFNYSKCDPNNR